MKLYLIRHGQTDWNLQKRIQGRQDIPLNAAGQAQALLLAGAMKKHPVTVIYSSPQLRAMDTARAITAVWNVPVRPLPQLAEISYGDWEGRTSQEIMDTDRELYEAWWKHPAGVAPPGGETLAQVDKRCEKAWDIIRRSTKGDTAVVAHGGTLAHFIVHLLKGLPDAKELVVSNVSITTIEYDSSSGVCRLLSLNDCSHLTGTTV